MKVYKIINTDMELVFGTPEDNLNFDGIIIGQKKDCSEFLILTDIIDNSYLTETTDYIDFDFTYNQSWGLTINDSVVIRVIKEITYQGMCKVSVDTVDSNGNNITIDGDIFRVNNDRPSSLIMLQNAYNSLTDLEEVNWIDYSNNIVVLNKNSILIAINKISDNLINSSKRIK